MVVAAPPSHDPYTASLRYAVCMRAHGVPHPDPDRSGNFRLTPEQERLLKSVSRSRRIAADKACFHELKGLNNRPLTAQAKRRALGVLREVRRCMAGFGISLGKPVVENRPRGRAAFGFENAPPPTQAQARAQRVCEARVDLAGKLDEIIAEDRSGL